ncbi:MAG: group II intron reverse transcriptase/maturase [Marinifilum sp.]|jgi:group II intron reverse transcriptase/maturase|nr:group II intron reverse transcriptase/maturase [Marinifilum sp.]
MSRIFKEKTKPLPISKSMLWQAFKKVRKNKGSAGVDRVSIQDFESDLNNNLYKLWNRLASGSYFPPMVKEVIIPKGRGKTRSLGIPTVGDRICQQVIKDIIEPRLEKEFSDQSYGYRPLISAHQALENVRDNTRKFAWIIDLDISKFFDNMAHSKLMLALDKHIEENWIKVYIKRWLEVSKLKTTGEIQEPLGKGTPQGGVISPLLANLYLHYTLDKWMELHFPDIPLVRYADDIIIHCRTESQAKFVLSKVQSRLQKCNLSANSEKTKIVYCKDYRRKETGKLVQFDFLGFSFKPCLRKSSKGGVFLGRECTVSKSNYSSMVKEIRDLKFHCRTEITIEDIANLLNPKIRGWIQYFEKFSKGSLKNVFHRLHNRLAKWILNKYKRFRRSRRKAFDYLRKIRKHYPYLFYHWQVGYALV